MALASILYPLSSFIFLRLALVMFARWASRRRSVFLVAGIVFMAFTLDAGYRLFATAAIMPYWWITPLIGVAFVWIVLTTTRNQWRKLGAVGVSAVATENDPLPK